MIRKRGRSDEPEDEFTENYEADAQAAGLEHWSAPPGYIPQAFDAEEDDSGPSWQTDEEDTWTGSELTDVFEVPDEFKQPKKNDTGELSAVKKSIPPEDDLFADRIIPSQEPVKSKSNSVSASTNSNRVNPSRGENDPRVIRARQIAAKRAAANKAEQQSQVRALAEKQAAERQEFARQKMLAQNALAEGQRIKPLDTQRSAEPGLAQIDIQDNDEFGFLDEKPKSDRNLGQASLVGAGLLILAAAAIFVNAYTALALIGIASLLAVAELYQSMRKAGLRPAKLLGYVGTLAIPTAAFFRGEAAYPLVACLIIVFGALWYLIGADTERPVLNLSLTVFGMVWIGGLAGFAAMMLKSDYALGRQLLIATVIITAVSDILAYFGGRTYGANPFHSASPNKTWEGTLTGFVGALLAGVIIAVMSGVLSFDNLVFEGEFTAAITFAAVIGVLAPIGDLAQSLIKRDLGIKDMGFILPGHGGVLDRIDGLLFALPGAYYLATLFDLISIA